MTEQLLASVYSVPNGLKVTVPDGFSPHTHEFNLKCNRTNYPLLRYQEPNPVVRQKPSYGETVRTRNPFTSIYTASFGTIKNETSVPVTTEYPPQFRSTSPGFANFEVGGYGSGSDAFRPEKIKEGVFHGGMTWPDRGNVFKPQPVTEVEHFATTLRKYPENNQKETKDVYKAIFECMDSRNACCTERVCKEPAKKSHKNLQTYTRPTKQQIKTIDPQYEWDIHNVTRPKSHKNRKRFTMNGSSAGRNFNRYEIYSYDIEDNGSEAIPIDASDNRAKVKTSSRQSQTIETNLKQKSFGNDLRISSLDVGIPGFSGKDQLSQLINELHGEEILMDYYDYSKCDSPHHSKTDYKTTEEKAKNEDDDLNSRVRTAREMLKTNYEVRLFKKLGKNLRKVARDAAKHTTAKCNNINEVMGLFGDKRCARCLKVVHDDRMTGQYRDHPCNRQTCSKVKSKCQRIVEESTSESVKSDFNSCSDTTCFIDLIETKNEVLVKNNDSYSVSNCVEDPTMMVQEPAETVSNRSPQAASMEETIGTFEKFVQATSTPVQKREVTSEIYTQTSELMSEFTQSMQPTIENQEEIEPENNSSSLKQTQSPSRIPVRQTSNNSNDTNKVRKLVKCCKMCGTNYTRVSKTSDDSFEPNANSTRIDDADVKNAYTDEEEGRSGKCARSRSVNSPYSKNNRVDIFNKSPNANCKCQQHRCSKCNRNYNTKNTCSGCDKHSEFKVTVREKNIANYSCRSNTNPQRPGSVQRSGTVSPERRKQSPEEKTTSSGRDYNIYGCLSSEPSGDRNRNTSCKRCGKGVVPPLKDSERRRIHSSPYISQLERIIEEKTPRTEEETAYPYQSEERNSNNRPVIRRCSNCRSHYIRNPKERSTYNSSLMDRSKSKKYYDTGLRRGQERANSKYNSDSKVTFNRTNKTKQYGHNYITSNAYNKIVTANQILLEPKPDLYSTPKSDEDKLKTRETFRNLLDSVIANLDLTSTDTSTTEKDDKENVKETRKAKSDIVNPPHSVESEMLACKKCLGEECPHTVYKYFNWL